MCRQSLFLSYYRVLTLYLKLDVIPIFKSFTLSFSKHVELAYEKKNIGLFFIFVILLYLFLHFLRSFIHSLSRLVFITKLAPLPKEIWDVFSRFVFLL